MRRLLLLLILSPVVLFGQTRQKAIVDSLKAATNLRDVSKVIGNCPDTKEEHLQVTDNGDYVTITVRVHITVDLINALLPLPVVKFNIKAVVTEGLNMVTLPPLPEPPAEPLTPLAVTLVKIGSIVPVRADTAALPPFPEPPAEPLVPLMVTELRVNEPVAGKVHSVQLPPFDVKTEIIQPLEAVNLPILYFAPHKPDTVAVPSFEEKKIPVIEMHLSERGYSLLEKMEGFSPEPYSLRDGGMTIGFGFFIPDGEGRKWDKGVTLEEAEVMIREKMPAYEDQVKRYINVPLTQEEFDALTMMAYNLGGFSKATSIVNDINTNADFEKLQKDWMRFVHSKAPGVMKGLMNRRKDEMLVRNESEYQSERKIQIFKIRK